MLNIIKTLADLIIAYGFARLLGYRAVHTSHQVCAIL